MKTGLAPTHFMYNDLPIISKKAALVTNSAPCSVVVVTYRHELPLIHHYTICIKMHEIE